MLQIVSRANGKARYELTTTGKMSEHSHAHFVCSDCDVVLCLPEEALTKPKLRGRWAASLNQARVQLQGQCPSCIIET